MNLTNSSTSNQNSFTEQAIASKSAQSLEKYFETGRHRSTFRRIKRGECCPICGDGVGKCKISEDGEAVLCMEAHSQHDAPTGWKFTRETGNGIWGIFVAQNEKTGDRSFEELLRVKQQRQAQKSAERAIEEAAQKERAMPIEERVIYNERIIKNLHLNSTHEQDLLNRGMDLEIIDIAGYRSVERWQTIPGLSNIPLNFPGVTRWGNAIAATAKGYLIPVRDVEGQVINFQVAYESGQTYKDADGEEVSVPKYTWLNSGTLGNKTHNEFDELPLQVFRAENGSKKAILTEGTGAKPAITFQKNRNSHVIGAAGGNFSGSAQTLLHTLKTLGVTHVEFAPDAGAILNHHVMVQYRRTFDLLEQNGFKVKILWWGQETKEGRDYDEIDASVEVARITVKQFLKLDQSNSDRAKQAENQKVFDSRRWLIEQRQKNFLEHANRVKQTWYLTPGKKDIVYQGYAPDLEIDLSRHGNWIGLHGVMGAGKTEAIARTICTQLVHEVVMITSPRNGLLRQTGARIEQMAKEMGVDVRVYHYQDDVALHRDLMRNKQPGVYLMAPDSFKTYSTGANLDWSSTISILDEANGLLGEIVSKSGEISAEFEEMMEHSRFLIASDAFLSDASLQYIRKHRGYIKDGYGKVYRQDFKKSDKSIHFVETVTNTGMVLLKQDGASFTVVDHLIAQGMGTPERRIAIASTSKNEAKALKKYFESKNIEVALIAGDTIDFNKKYLSNPNQIAIDYPNFGAFIITPTLQSGADIQIHFAAGIVFDSGNLDPTQVMQMLGRFRQCPEFYIISPRKKEELRSDFSFDKEALRERAEKAAIAFEALNMHLSSKTAAWQQYQKEITEFNKNLGAEHLRYIAAEYYQTVDTFEVMNGDRAIWLETRKEVKDEESLLMLESSLETGNKLLSKGQNASSDKDFWAIELATLCAKLPGLVEKQQVQFLALDPNDNEERKQYAELITELRQGRIDGLTNNIEMRTWTLGDQNRLNEQLKRGNTLKDPAFKKQSYLFFYNRCKLGSLTKIRKDQLGKDANVKDAFYNADSFEIIERFKIFQLDKTLQQCFSEIETIHQFVRLLRKIMQHFGYEKVGKQVRRFGQSKYATAFIALNEQGNKLYRMWFAEIRDAILRRLEQIRAKDPDEEWQFEDMSLQDDELYFDENLIQDYESDTA